MNKIIHLKENNFKWNSNEEFSENYMLRILEKISFDNLNQCQLTYDSDLG